MSVAVFDINRWFVSSPHDELNENPVNCDEQIKKEMCQLLRYKGKLLPCVKHFCIGLLKLSLYVMFLQQLR